MKNLYLLYFLLVFQWFDVIAQGVKIDPELFTAFEKSSNVEYIVYMKDRVTFQKPLPFRTKQEKAAYVYQCLVDKANHTQSPILQYVSTKKLPHQSFYITNAIKIKSGIEDMYRIAEMSGVEWIFYNGPIKMLDYEEHKIYPASRNAEPEWGIQMIKADSVWALGHTGTGVVIGGQDTGYAWEVSPLKNKYLGFIDSTLVDHNFHWHDAIHERNPIWADSLINLCGFNLSAPCDDNNHGTHTMGTIVGEDDENQIGVAPGAKWIGCRNMDRGWGTPTTYMECFEWFLAPYDLNGENADPSKAPHVINNSWSCPVQEGCNLSNFYLMNDMVNNLKASGIVVVASAGNSGPACNTINGPPAIFENSFTIGATTDVDTIAQYSARGLVTIDSSFRLKPNVVAPGSRVRSVVRNGGFANFSGTSMAGPHVAGLVALLISANPELAGEVDVIEDILESTALPKTFEQDCDGISGQTIPNPVYGHGRVDALAAVQKALSIPGSNENINVVDRLAVFPNPADDVVTFHLKNDGEHFESVLLYNTSGQMLYHDLFHAEKSVKNISLHHLPKGIYVYQIISSLSNSYTGRVIKI